jgi:hypothetical protein
MGVAGNCQRSRLSNLGSGTRQMSPLESKSKCLFGFLSVDVVAAFVAQAEPIADLIEPLRVRLAATAEYWSGRVREREREKKEK